MALATAIMQILASIISYLAARGIDMIISRWVAYFVITWEKVATKAAIEEYNKTKTDMVAHMADKWKEWEKWRDSVKPPHQGG